MDFAVPADNGVKIKETKNKYLDLARELRKLWNMKVTVILVVTGALRTVFKDLEEWKIRGRDYPNHSIIDIDQNTEKKCHSVSSERPSVNADVKTHKVYYRPDRTQNKIKRKWKEN